MRTLRLPALRGELELCSEQPVQARSGVSSVTLDPSRQRTSTFGQERHPGHETTFRSSMRHE